MEQTHLGADRAGLSASSDEAPTQLPQKNKRQSDRLTSTEPTTETGDLQGPYSFCRYLTVFTSDIPRTNLLPYNRDSK